MRHFQRSSLTAVAAILAAVSVRAAAPSTDIPANVDAVAKAEITASALRAPVRFLASDELEGRGPATRGDALARLYLSAQLETLGYQPGGDNGGWEQAVEVVGVAAKLPATWNFTGKGGGFALKWARDRAHVPLVIVIANGIAYIAFAIAGLPLLGRYLFELMS